MSMRALRSLKAKRATIKAQCTRTRNVIDAVDPNAIDFTHVKQRRDKFTEHWNQFNRIQAQIDELLATSDDLENVEQLKLEQETEYIEFEEMYFNVAGKIERFLKAESVSTDGTRDGARETRDNERSQFLYARDISQVHLPKIAIPKFSGKYEDWYPFHNTFESIIHSNTKLTDIQRFHYLISSLEGDAAHVIKSLEITSDNYHQALDLLKQRYDDKRVIAQEHIKALYELPTVPKGNHSVLRKLIDDVLRHLRSLKSLGRQTEQWDDLIVYLIISKLDATLTSDWEDHIPPGDIPTLKQLTDFLTHKCKTLSTVSKRVPSDSTNLSMRKATGKATSVHLTTTNICCFHCKGKHYIFQCPSFLKLSSEDRNKEARAKRLCINCLRSTTHQARECRSSTCQTCSKRHNTLLHIQDKEVKIQKDSESADQIRQAVNAGAVTLNHHTIQGAHKEIILSTAIVTVNDQHGKSHTCRALLDSGAMSNFITDKLARKLNLHRRQVNMSLSGINMSQAHSCHTVNIQIKSMHSSYTQNMECYVLDSITEKLPQTHINICNFRIPNNIKLADPQFHIPADIDILMGNEHFWKLICVGQIHEHKGQPTLQKTQLGWIVSGKIYNHGPMKSSQICTVSINQQINQAVARFWSIEHIPEEVSFNPEEKQCMKRFAETTTRDQSGRFVVQMPFKQEILQQLGESRSTALNRFLSLERKLQKQPDIKEMYVQFMKEYQTLGHMIPINDERTQGNTQRYYIPHHAVLKTNSLTTKLRVVFDASCKTSTGVSLNECLSVGPVLQQDLFSILLRFCTLYYVITADIARMYRQVRIDKSQTHLQTIFWRNDPRENITAFELQTVTYGTACASFLAIRTMQELASINATTYPLGSATIMNNFYVDDLLSGADTKSDLRALRDETIKVLEQGDFHLRKWASNCPEILKDIPCFEPSAPIHFINHHEDIHTLGMQWNIASDSFQYDINIIDTSKVTKRIMLSALSKIFDPLGLLGPVTLFAKILIQRVWILNLAWDETVPMDIHTAWRQLESQLNMIRNFKIPRYVSCKNAISLQIHGFSDASERAYGACVYLTARGSHKIKTRLLCSKSRVAPLKAITLPRLELCGALLLAQLVNKVLKAIHFKPDAVYYWTDSTIVLHWIRATDKTWNTFVSNRVGEIHALSQANNWLHVSTECNPADHISRGTLPSSLVGSELWWSGPLWLSKEAQDWDTSIPSIASSDLPEQKQITKTMVIIDNKQDIFERFSSLTKLIRITALCLRFIRFTRNKFKNQENKITGRISTSELINSNLRLVKIVQEATFSEDLHALKTKGSVPRKSKLSNLSPFLDSQGIIRVGGRLLKSSLAMDAKHQMLLPGNHPFTQLVIRHEHYKQLHAGTQATLAAIRMRYWPLSARSNVKKLLRKCITCFKTAPRNSEAIMSNLPTYRVTPSKPFAFTGVDYCGPIHIKSGRLRTAKLEKAYIAIFICLATKAVHIELVSSLTTDAFLNSLKRFIARRGKVTHIYSDNGTNFQGASNTLKDLYRMLHHKSHQDKVDQLLKEDFIEWHFIPPHAPHFGGIWEAAVKSAKIHLKRIVSDAALTFEEMYTVLTQIEAVMNSRPITPLSDDPNDLTYLTPGHFLVGDALTSFPQQDVTHVPINRLSRWQRVIQINQHFWKRWSHEYLQQLQQRTKWQYSKGLQPTVGDMVMLRESDTAPMQWLIGRIEEVYPGTDGTNRVVSVRTSKGTYKRPITKICILPLQKDD